jgi:hypothetical protein
LPHRQYLSAMRQLLIIIASCATTQAFAQDPIQNLMTQPISNCETVAVNGSQNIVLSGFNELEKKAILAEWEKQCGPTEPILRFRTIQLLQAGIVEDSVIDHYFKNHVDRFKNRVLSARKEDYFYRFESERAYLNYVPLRSGFDRWTKQKADSLLLNLPKGSSGFLLCTLFAEAVANFEILVNDDLYKNSVMRTVKDEEEIESHKDWNRGLIFTLSAGVWFPLGKMEQTFKPSPHFGLTFGMPVSYDLSWRVDLGIFLRPLADRKEFQINTNYGVDSTKGDMCVSFGGWLTKEVPLSKKSFVDLTAGVALGSIGTGIKKPRQRNDTQDSYYSVDTIDSSVGLGLRTILTKRKSIGVNARFHYVPFGSSRVLVSDIGNCFVTTGCYFRF